MTSRIARPLSLMTAALLAAGTLSACASSDSNPVGLPTSPASPSAPPTTTTPATPAPTTPANGTIAGTDPGVACDTILPQATVDTVATGFSAREQFSPADPTVKDVITAGGTLCAWESESGGFSIEMAVITLNDDAVPTATAQYLDKGTPTTLFTADAASFTVQDRADLAQAIKGNTWIVMSSAVFATDAEAAPLMNQALRSF
ncbi:hypothetical protein [Klugiella xanthotipulae]|uniref:DUF3558 domain-containing protein n=1 Tax=Klugiella xanthotipulae TaxID=244735 RepID=A0A543HY41_9MICO|nr:hypothetical protein [Klugiella xanthotipulae]TQM63251.1 hypothetical protein FB466_1507 [Klugiella xanthotipulae]